MNMRVLVLFLGIIMISSTVSISSSEAFLPENLPDVSQASSHVRVIEGENLIAFARPLYTSPDDPSNHQVPTSDPHDGVAKLILTRTDGTFGCSGTLADDKIHVFTAAHCVADDNGNYILTSGSATFEGNSESVTIFIDASNSLSHPSYDGDYIKGNDIAILKLTSTAPVQIPGIPHATSGSAVSTVVDKSGYGLSGYFSSGTDSSTYNFGTERNGQNRYDAFADTMYVALGLTSDADFIPGAIYQFDSDDGTSSHDAFGFFFGIPNLGLGNNEVMSASGDSGGPTFANGELIGITSYGITLQYTNKQTSDCTKQFGGPKLDSSCGEFAGDTRVSQYTDFIDSVLTPIVDLDSPVITIINTDTSSTTSTITWTTDEPSTSLVNYGLDVNRGMSVSDANYVISHSVQLVGLSPSTVYHYNVTSVDSSNNSASSDDATFTTTSPPTLVSISISPVNSSITEGSTQQFTATGTYSDNTNQILSDVTWSSSSTNITTIDVNGLAIGVLAGSTTITAISGSQQDSTVLEVTTAQENATTVSVSSITYSSEGGKNKDKHLLVTIALIDHLDAPVSGASVSIDLFRDDNFIAQGTATTAIDGTVTFSLKNASSGHYETDITNVIASSLTFVDDYIDTGYDK